MKINLFVISVLLIMSIFYTPSVMGQAIDTTVKYSIVSNLLYQNETKEPLDDYMNKRCRLDIYYPASQKGFATVVWFHGGGLSSGEKFIPEPLKNKNIAVVGVNYRLYPKVSTPAYIDDAAAAVAWVMKNIQNYGGDPELVFVSGHSAGGYLTSMIGLDKRWLAKYDTDANKIAGLIPFSGHAITHFVIRKEKGIPDTQPIVDEYAPLFHVRKDAPPLVLITGDRELEMLGRYEEDAYLMRMMKVVGHKNTSIYEMKGCTHGSMAAPAFPILLEQVKLISKQIKDKKTVSKITQKQ